MHLSAVLTQMLAALHTITHPAFISLYILLFQFLKDVFMILPSVPSNAVLGIYVASPSLEEY